METIEVLMGVTSIIVAVIAIIMSVLFWTFSTKSMHKSDNALELIRNTSNRLDTQISQNFGRLVDGALSTLPQDRILRWCVSGDKLSRLEGQVKKIVYIHAATLRYETGRFIDVVANNLNRDVRYVYFIPDDGSLDAEVRTFLSTLHDKGLNIDKLKANLAILKVKTGEIISNITLFDPDIGSKTGYILPAFLEQNDTFLVQLDDHLHDKLYKKALDWENTGKIYFPGSEFDEIFKKR